jgi:hypothetical protein
MKTKLTALLILLLVVQLACRASAQRSAATNTAAVPEKYQGLYDHLNQNLDTDLAAVKPDPGAGHHATTFAAELIVADDNRGEDLLRPETLPAVKLYLDRLQAMGIRGVKNAIQFPFFTPSFPRYNEYLDFYRQVADEIQRRGMTWTIQASILFANTPFSPVTYDFSKLTFDSYKQQDRAMIETILREFKPDYLVVVAEPDTAAKLTGLREFNDAQKTVELVNYLLDGLDRGSSKICAGTGTWTPPSFTRLLDEQTKIDCVSIHIYPIDTQFIQNALTMANDAHANGKSVIVSEAWLYKTDQPGAGGSIASDADIFKLDNYSFWSPLDQKFIQLMADFADKTGVDFVSLFWSPFLFSYVDYSARLESAPYSEVRQQANSASFEALSRGELSPIGLYYQTLINSR